MKSVIKKSGKIVQAYRLGDEGPVIKKLINEGKIKKIGEDFYEVFSQETDVKGEIAYSCDYIKVDSAGCPYPNSEKFFKENHVHVSGDDYEQLPKPLYAWEASDGMCKEIVFLIEQKGLIINEASEEKYFTAPLWGTMLSAAKDAVIIFYELLWDKDGNVVEADFNFVAKSEFDKTYDVM